MITIVYLEKEAQSKTDMFYRKLAHITDEPGDRICNGIECVYMPIDTDRGIKLYRYWKEALGALESQAEAFRHQIGPEVLSNVMEFLFPIGSEQDAPAIKRFFKQGIAYGYYTIKVDTQKVKDTMSNNMALYKEHYEQLRTRIREANIGFPIYDLHNDNIAYTGDTLVAIDFGWHTTFKISGTELNRRHPSWHTTYKISRPNIHQGKLATCYDSNKRMGVGYSQFRVKL